jgi:hypothetical protein
MLFQLLRENVHSIIKNMLIVQDLPRGESQDNVLLQCRSPRFWFCAEKKMALLGHGRQQGGCSSLEPCIGLPVTGFRGLQNSRWSSHFFEKIASCQKALGLLKVNLLGPYRATGPYFLCNSVEVSRHRLFL